MASWSCPVESQKGYINDEKASSISDVVVDGVETILFSLPQTPTLPVEGLTSGYYLLAGF